MHSAWPTSQDNAGPYCTLWSQQAETGENLLHVFLTEGSSTSFNGVTARIINHNEKTNQWYWLLQRRGVVIS